MDIKKRSAPSRVPLHDSSAPVDDISSRAMHRVMGLVHPDEDFLGAGNLDTPLNRRLYELSRRTTNPDVYSRVYKK